LEYWWSYKDIDDDNDDDKGNEASMTTCDKGDNQKRDNGKDACALTATMHDTASHEAAAHREAEAVQRDATQQAESRGEVEASTRQPAVERETTVVAANHHRTWQRPPWSLRLRLWPSSLQTMPMAATAVLPLLAACLSRWGVG